MTGETGAAAAESKKVAGETPAGHSRLEALLGWLGTALSIAGALLMSLNIPQSGLAYALFLPGSFCLLLWARLTGHKHQILLNSVFVSINLLGVARWILN